MRRWDFVAAFLQGELLDNEVVYCSVPSGYATGLDASNPSAARRRHGAAHHEAHLRHGAGGAALAADHLSLPHSRGFRRHRVRLVRVQQARNRPQTPSDPRATIETLIIG